MSRKVLCEWFQTGEGKSLQQIETSYLKRAITLGCKQTILQMGGLGWENQFIDCSLYQRFTVVDKEQYGCEESIKIRGNVSQLPIASDCVDMIILPHLLEYVPDHYQVLREVERVLKPEGQLIVLGFNPWNILLRYRSLIKKGGKNPFRGHFVSRYRMVDRLRLMNFEAEVAAGFSLDDENSGPAGFEKRKNSLMVTAYAVKAIKRRYNVIPLTPVKNKRPCFAVAGGVDATRRVNYG